MWFHHTAKDVPSVAIASPLVEAAEEIIRLRAFKLAMDDIYSRVWGADGKKDADVCEAFERVILRHNL